MEKIENNRSLKIIFLLLSIAFISPSLVYMLKGRTIKDLGANFNFFYTNTEVVLAPSRIMGAIFFLIIFLGLAYVYFKILKNHKNIFETKKQMVIFIIVISIIFFIMLPLTSTDVFYYIGTGWAEAHYGINPYYTSVDNLFEQNPDVVNDQILSKMKGIWSNETIVYGPVWPLICKILSGLSMGNLTLALFIYKLFNLSLHILNAYLIYKIARNKKRFPLMYALNPLILFDGLANVHNEMLLVFLILLALYFFIRKKNMALTVVFLALGSAVKYVAILLVPFLVLYYYRKEKPTKKIIYSIFWAILFIAVLTLCYLFYMQDITVLKGIITQQGKFSNSIFVLVAIKNVDWGLKISEGFMLAFIVIYIIELIKLVFTTKQYTFYELIRKYNALLLLFIFGTITNFHSWYILWLFATIIWQKSKDIKLILAISIIVEVCNVVYFFMNENYIYCVPYCISMFVLMLITAYIIRKNEKNKLANIQKLTNL